MKNIMTVIKGAGDLATGVASRLFRSGFPVVMTELKEPTVVRRKVAFAEAVYTGSSLVEGITARLTTFDSWQQVLKNGEIPVLIDPEARVIEEAHPQVIIDAIIAKKNTGTHSALAPVVIALGPGFTAPQDAHAVIETQRGHDLGRVFYEGAAAPDTGIPGEVGGKTEERILRAPCQGIFKSSAEIGDWVKKGQLVGEVAGLPVVSLLDGYVRGLLKSGLCVYQGMKIGDVDHRAAQNHCFTISDKARALGGAALEAMLFLLRQQQIF